MQRICTSLAENGYAVTLVGRKLPSSLPLAEKKFKQKRLHCWFKKGKLFYAEFNIRLYWYLLFRKMDALCAIDLDTIMPCLKISRLKKIPRIYDAHELFTEMKEVITRPRIKKAWTRIEKRCVPQFKLGYTVSEGIAEEFKQRYGVNYETIRNVPVLTELWPPKKIESSFFEEGPYILYQGAVNEARGFEWLIPAMQWVDAPLIICGDGNFMPALRSLIEKYNVQNKIGLMGMIPPDNLKAYSRNAAIGISLAEKEGLNQWMALPNKFFDYVHAALPQVTMNYPEYRKINDQYEVALLIDEPEPKKIAETINKLLADPVLHNRLKENCKKAREIFNWQQEEQKLISFYQAVFNK